MQTSNAPPAPANYWTDKGRAVVFLLSSSSIVCLLLDLYQLCSMRTFAVCIFSPALVLLFALALADKCKGDGELFRKIMIGVIAGLLAAVAYDVFRLPFVYSKSWGIDSIIPHMDLFKVFPRFGAMILNEPLEQSDYSRAANIVGWAYHFSNGLTFGVMYLAIVGEATGRKWIWAVAIALGLELAMLSSPYPSVFGIQVTGAFVMATLAAHLIFGITLGKTSQLMSLRRLFL